MKITIIRNIFVVTMLILFSFTIQRDFASVTTKKEKGVSKVIKTVVDNNGDVETKELKGKEAEKEKALSALEVLKNQKKILGSESKIKEKLAKLPDQIAKPKGKIPKNKKLLVRLINYQSKMIKKQHAEKMTQMKGQLKEQQKIIKKTIDDPKVKKQLRKMRRMLREE